MCARMHAASCTGRNNYRGRFNSAAVLERPKVVTAASDAACRCGNVAGILELDEHLTQVYKVFDAAPQEVRGAQAKRTAPDYFL